MLLKYSAVLSLGLCVQKQKPTKILLARFLGGTSLCKVPVTRLRPAHVGASRAVRCCFLHLSMLTVLLVENTYTNEPSYKATAWSNSYPSPGRSVNHVFPCSSLFWRCLKDTWSYENRDTTSFLLSGSRSVPPLGVWEVRLELLSYFIWSRGWGCDSLRCPSHRIFRDAPITLPS